VLNSIAAGRRLAQRVAVTQTVATLATALICLFWGMHACLGALAGGLALVIGSGLAAWGAFGGGVASGGVMLGRILLGTALKWVVVAVCLYLAIAVWRLPALAVLAGAITATATWLFAVKSKT
jgi:F0F1-type ATP synthase assembly protein I